MNFLFTHIHTNISTSYIRPRGRLKQIRESCGSLYERRKWPSMEDCPLKVFPPAPFSAPGLERWRRCGTPGMAEGEVMTADKNAPDRGKTCDDKPPHRLRLGDFFPIRSPPWSPSTERSAKFVRGPSRRALFLRRRGPGATAENGANKINLNRIA